MLSKPVLTAIALVVTFVWLASFMAQFIPSLGYKADPQIHVIFGLLITGLFAAPAVPKMLGRGQDESDDPGRHRKSGSAQKTED